jgi:hypothetical protein
MTKMIDLTNKRFGRLLAKSFVGIVGKNPHNQWYCVCDCGNNIVVSGANLRSNITNSCGCLQKEKTSKANTKHGYSQKSKEYSTWANMRKRCNNPNSEDYIDYGARGIKVCERWDSFSNFLKDMGFAPKGYSLDRIDVNKGYSPENCRWADAKTQARNKTNNRLITVDGIIKTLAEWAELSGTDRRNIHKRIVRGWSAKQAIFGKNMIYKDVK